MPARGVPGPRASPGTWEVPAVGCVEGKVSQEKGIVIRRRGGSPGSACHLEPPADCLQKACKEGAG